MPPHRVWLFRAILLPILLTLPGLAYERIEVGSGSMAPTFLGPHRVATCPECGESLRVGLHPRDDGQRLHSYERVRCPHCDHSLDRELTTSPMQPGARVWLNRAAYLFSAPSRWDVVVFRSGEESLLKRIVGLPGERLELREGDVYLGGQLLRKTWQEMLQVRQLVQTTTQVIVLDNNQQQRFPLPRPGQQSSWLGDEYPCNSALAAPLTPVHDFITEVEVTLSTPGTTIYLELTDGTGTVRATVSGSAETHTRQPVTLAVLSGQSNVTQLFPPLALHQRHTVQLALVDRRAILAYPAQELLQIDLAPGGKRPPVLQPATIGVSGGMATIHQVRLFRDIHYTTSGRYGTAGQVVQLGAGEYFVLGDNSPLARDGRHFGPIPRNDIIGRVIK